MPFQFNAFAHMVPAAARPLLMLMAVAALVSGCMSVGEGVEFAPTAEAVPEIERILRDLAANDAHVKNFRGAGTFTLESPEFDAVKKFRGSIKFRRPSDLYVQGNHRITNIPLFKLTCVGSEFLMEFPGSQDRSFYQFEGTRYVDVPFSVSPSDIAREMFLPEDWRRIKRREVRVLRVGVDGNVAILEIGPKNAPRREIEVARVNPENPRWVVVKNTRLADTGDVIARTTLEGYSAIGAALFPTSIDAWFPTEQTRMTFTMRNIRLNTNLPNEDFDIRARARELNLAHAPHVYKRGLRVAREVR